MYPCTRWAAAAALLLAAAARAADPPKSAPPATVPHTFRYTPPAGTPAAAASVVGDFNGWSPTANVMVRANDGAYLATVDVPVGLHHYKVVYDGKWIPDPTADHALDADDGFGGKNSGIDVKPPAAPTGPVAVHTFGYVPPAGAATVAVSVAGDFNGWSATPNPMPRAADGSYHVTVEMAPGLHHYKIVYDGKWIVDPAADHALDADDGFGDKNSGFMADPPPPQ